MELIIVYNMCMPRELRPYEELPLFAQIEDEDHGCGCIPMVRNTGQEKVLDDICFGDTACAIDAIRASGVPAVLERRAGRKFGNDELLSSRNLIADIFRHILNGDAATPEQAVDIEHGKRVTRLAVARTTFCASPPYVVHV